MSTTSRWFTSAALAIALCAGCNAMKKDNGEHEDAEEAGEVKMALADIPAAAREGLQREAGAGATIKEVDRMEQNGATIYETDVESGGKTWEIQVDSAGKLVSKKAEEDEGEGKQEKEDDEKK